MILHKPHLAFAVAVIMYAMAGRSVLAADDNAIDAKAYSQAVDRAIQFLESKGQAADGSFSAQAGPGVTAVATAGILRHGAARTILPWPRA